MEQELHSPRKVLYWLAILIFYKKGCDMVKKTLFCSVVLLHAVCVVAHEVAPQEDIVVVDPAPELEVMQITPEEGTADTQELTLENLLQNSAALYEFYTGLSEQDKALFGQLLEELQVALAEVSTTLENVVEKYADILSKLKVFIGAQTIAFRISLHAE